VRTLQVARRSLLLLGLVGASLSVARLARAQQTGVDSVTLRAMELENTGKYREAVPLYRAGLRGAEPANALLGLERVYAELGWQDSLFAPLDSLIAARPREALFRTVRLRTLDMLGRESLARASFEDWTRAVPGDPSPYREYARILLERNRTNAADSVVRRAQLALGSTKDLQLEVAQLRAALGMWVASASAWRPALVTSPYLDQAAVYALRPTPAPVRDSVRQVLLAPPAQAGPRLALAGLEGAWGSAADGWAALRDLPLDSLSAAAWTEYGERAEGEGRWILAREAFTAALRWRRTPELALRAATAALESGDPAAALALAPLSDAPDSATAAERRVPVRARALSLLGRPLEAERLVQSYDRFFTPGARARLSRVVAFGWVRTGDVTRARAALVQAGADGDSSEAGGWLALYEGDLKTARVLLRRGGESTPELALALGLVARLRGDTARAVGQAFLALARGDTTEAAARFEAAAGASPLAASLLLSTAAQLRAARKDVVGASALWQRVLTEFADSPEAPGAELELARLLRRKGDAAGAAARLEHLILTYPRSSLVPQARRELDLAKQNIPGS
jgi:tetratricopeptide (TPR) repeat protein